MRSKVLYGAVALFLVNGFMPASAYATPDAPAYRQDTTKPANNPSMLVKTQDSIFIHSIKNNPGKVGSITLLSQLSRYVPLAEKQKLYDALDTAIQNSESGRAYAAQLLAEKSTAIGQPAPDFTMNDVNDKPVSLSSFRGKYLFIDFWASWCGPCLKENPHVVAAYRKFHSKGLEILGVSLDILKPAWLYMIEKEELSWTHVSDLKGWKNAVAVQYGIKSIPANLLLDKNGIIIAKNLRGEELEKKLQEVFQ